MSKIKHILENLSDGDVFLIIVMGLILSFITWGMIDDVFFLPSRNQRRIEQLEKEVEELKRK